MLKRRFLLLFFSVVALVCAATALAGCSESKPWFGTYYYKGQTIVIDEKNFVESTGAHRTYTISGNVMTLDNGVEFRLENDYQVLYSPQYLFMRHGETVGTSAISTRNGKLDDRLVPNPASERAEIFDFKPDGTFTYFVLGNARTISGTYTLNSGVLILYDFGPNGGDTLLYINENYNIYMYPYIKDLSKFNFFPSESQTGGNETGDNETGGNETGGSQTGSGGDETGGSQTGGSQNNGEKFTVTLDWEIPDMPDTVTEIYQGGTYILPMPGGRSGYTFKGWYTDNYGSKLSVWDSVNVTQNVTYHADWEIVEYKITFVTDHGETPQTVTFTVRNIQFITLPVLNDEKFTFGYWAFDKEGKEKVEAITQPKDYTLYAVWLEIPPFHTGDITHLELEAGDICPNCGLRLEYKTADAALMIGDGGAYGCGEYYGTTAGDQLDRYDVKVNYIFISNETEEISESAFSGYNALRTVAFENDSVLTTINRRAFCDCLQLTSIKIPSAVTSIGEFAFGGCWNLTSAEIPGGVTAVNRGAFENCKSLTDIEIPNGVFSIESDAFYGCISLTDILIPNGVTSIGDHAFGNCENLTSIIIPKEITRIGIGAFNYCNNLKTAFYGGDLTAWNAIEINSGNTALLDNVYYFSPTAPEKAGRYWHYGNDGTTPEIWATENLSANAVILKKRYPVAADRPRSA